MKTAFVSWLTLILGAGAIAGLGCLVDEPLYCEGNGDCAGGWWCDVPWNTCRPPPDAGGSDAGLDRPVSQDIARDRSGEGPKLSRGSSCKSGDQCASTFCVDQVCCDKACAGECQRCDSGGSCGLEPDKTPCGGGDTCASDWLAQGRCDGKSPGCQTVKTPCAPYRCDAAGAACSAACAAHSDCSSGLCDLMTRPSPCVPEAAVCYVDITKPGPGSGTKQAPYPQIQPCLGPTGPAFAAVADGTYNENLKLSKDAVIYATGTSGSLVDGMKITKNYAGATLVPSGVTPAVDSNANGLGLHGFEIMSPAATSTGALLYLKGDRPIKIMSCDIHTGKVTGISISGGGTTTVPGVELEDVALTALDRGIDSVDVNLTIRDTVMSQNTAGALSHSGASLTLHDVNIGWNPNNGIVVYAAKLSFDRVRVSLNSGAGMTLENGCSGMISNTLVAGNLGMGITMSYNSAALVFANVTVVNNLGREVDCNTGAEFYNSVIWDKNSADTFTAKCTFYHSTVKGGASAAGTNISTKDPAFTSGSATDIYGLTLTSPCVDAGATTLSCCPGVAIPDRDLIGNKRRVNKITTKTGIIDQGAYEVQ